MPDAFGYTGIPSTLYAHDPLNATYATLVYNGTAWESVAKTLLLEEIHSLPRLRDYTTASAGSGSWSANNGTTVAYDTMTVNGIAYSIWQVPGTSSFLCLYVGAFRAQFLRRASLPLIGR